jgi:transposase
MPTTLKRRPGFRREEAIEAMIDILKVEEIRRLRSRGESIAGIARKVGVSEPTARKYIFKEDFSPKPPKPRMNREDGVLEPYKDAIENMLTEERTVQHKRLTAKRIFDLIVEEGYRAHTQPSAAT